MAIWSAILDKVINVCLLLYFMCSPRRQRWCHRCCPCHCLWPLLYMCRAHVHPVYAAKTILLLLLLLFLCVLSAHRICNHTQPFLSFAKTQHTSTASSQRLETAAAAPLIVINFTVQLKTITTTLTERRTKPKRTCMQAMRVAAAYSFRFICHRIC